jgi:peptide/nickel transport system permease protein
MVDSNSVPVVETEVPPQYSEFRRVAGVFFRRPLAAFGFIIICLLILTAIFAPLLAPYDPYQMNLKEQLQQPSKAHLLGTDALGRDTLSRIAYGSRTSLVIGIIAVGVSAAIGQLLGVAAAYFGGAVYAVIMRFIDALMAIPPILIALVIAAVIGSGLTNVIFAVGIGMIAPQARVMCGQALSIKQNDYILADRAMGASDITVMLDHIVPNAFPPLIVLATMQIGSAILLEAGLSFLGIGISSPEAAWGSMVNDGYNYLLTNPVLSIAPGVAIMLVVFGFNMMGDGLRDALDPRFRGIF